MATKQTKKSKGTSQILFHVPKALKNRFKITCIQQGSTMSNIMAQLMEWYIEGHNK